MDLRKKLTVYQKKLLDTGRRNKLINYNFSLSSNVELLNEGFEDIATKILDQISFKFAPLFENSNEFELDETKRVLACGKMVEMKNNYTFEEIKEIKQRFSPLKNVNYLYATTITSLLKRTLRNLKNKATVFYEENGINVLYLALGFITFTDIDGLVNRAPICLVPVSLESKNITSDYSLKAIDDAFVYNETLAYKLKLENKLQFPIPEQKDDILNYLEAVKEFALKNHFTVSNDLVLGLFSFSKIKMYQDVTDNMDIYLKNEPLNALCGDVSFLSKRCATEEAVGEDLEVLNADASQMEAIRKAKMGESFVLQGPPGCGKSQTITNIIGELIAQNKSVLFVCEKKAALDVVYRNLSKRGLKEFCLALHDPKTNKKDIIDGIYKNLENIQQNRQTLSRKALDVYQTFHGVEEKLDGYAKTLSYSPFNNEITVFDLLNIYFLNSDGDEVSYNYLNYPNIMNEEKRFNNFILKKERLGVNPTENPFYGFKLLELDLNQKETMMIVLQDFSKILTNVLRNQVFEQVDTLSIESIEDLLDCIPLYEFVLQLPGQIPLAYFQYEDLDRLYELILNAERCWLENKKIEKEIRSKYDSVIFELPVAEMLQEAKKYTSFTRVFHKRYRQIRVQLQQNLNYYEKMKYNEVLNDLKMLKKFIDSKKEIAMFDVELKVRFPEFYFGAQTDFTTLKNVIGYLQKYHQNALKIESYANDLESLVLSLSQNSLSQIDAEYTLIMPYVKPLKTAYEAYGEYFDSNNLTFDELLLRIKEQITMVSSVYDYMEYSRAKQQLDSSYPGISTILEKNGLKSVYKSFAKTYLLDINKKFNLSDDFITCMNEYGSCLTKILDFSSIKIGELVSDSWPQMDSLKASNSEVLMLRSEANKKKKLKPLRESFASMPKLLQDLKPCFMMSPISVATFIDPNVFTFDVVIFDEASQLTSENAIGSIARSKSIIVCGDQEQLPPTSFFAQETTDETDLEYDVYESILDECKTVLPTIMLKWHYRSKNESLIAYSNQEIYQDLLTFKEPYVKKEGQGVDFVYVADGVFEKGKNRVNRKEAEKVVEVVFDHFRKYPKMSLGIVTFNTTQQALIESLIAKKRYENKEFETFFSSDLPEPFFIKNLETVQGDERDRIIISVGYAKDDSGKLSMNFGPLNQTGGYKRLNVAITRAKENVTLIASILPLDFDLSKTNSKGVKMLQGYIDFAMNTKTNSVSSETEISAIGKEVATQIEKMGFKCHLKVGNSPIKVDIAVLDLNGIDYKLAIIIDGESYVRNKSSKDRNYLFDSVLKSRGWLVYHLFSFRYMQNKEGILEEIKLLLLDGTKAERIVSYDDEAYKEIKEVETLRARDLFEVYPNASSFAQLQANRNCSIEEKVFEVVKSTAPIYFEDLLKLLLPIYGKTKLVTSIRTLMEDDLDKLVKDKRIIKTNRFILLKGQIFDVKFRAHDPLNEETRDIEHIYLEEIVSGIVKILSVAKEMDNMSLFAVMSELLGYSKVTQKSIDVYQRALASAEALIEVRNGKSIYR